MFFFLNRCDVTDDPIKMSGAYRLIFCYLKTPENRTPFDLSINLQFNFKHPPPPKKKEKKNNILKIIK